MKQRLLRDALAKASRWRAGMSEGEQSDGDEASCSVVVHGSALTFSANSGNFQYVESSGDFVYRPELTAVREVGSDF